MACQEFHVGDTGTVIRVTVMDGDEAVDLSGATTLEIFFEKPDGTVVTKTATLVSGGTDGMMKYITGSDFFDQEGDWSYQGHVTTADGNWKSDINDFTVYPNLV